MATEYNGKICENIHTLTIDQDIYSWEQFQSFVHCCFNFIYLAFNKLAQI